MTNTSKTSTDLDKFALRKVQPDISTLTGNLPDSLQVWIEWYFRLAVIGVRSEEVTKKIALHLTRFQEFFHNSYGHDRISTCLRRDVVAWQEDLLAQGMAHSTVNNHIASLSAYTTWVHTLNPHLFPVGDPATGIRELGLPPLEPRALSPEQVRSLKNLCDRLERFHLVKGRRSKNKSATLQSYARPWRDRAIIYILLSTGLRREELVNITLDQVEPHTPEALRTARRSQIIKIATNSPT
jgi:site-specific recombinase XerD